MATANITTSAGRARLAARPEPYWRKVEKGRHLGFRRLETGGTWLARYTTGTTKAYHRLGSEADLPEHDDALKAALAWFKVAADDDRPTLTYTVAAALEAYVRDLRMRKSPDAASRAEQTANRHIAPQLGRVLLTKLTTARIKAWRDGLVSDSDDANAVRASKDTANRVLTVLKAALNAAFRDGMVREDSAWRRVKPFPNVGAARDVFLTAGQSKALQDACPEDFRALVRSALLTGARYSELTERRVSDLDLRQGVLRVPDGKTGARDVVLSDAGVAHFRALAKGKLPSALLHTRADGEPWGSSQQARRIRAAVLAANKDIKTPADRLPLATCFYSLRHTHASLALLAGVNLQVLAENLGTSIKMIEQHYGKFLRADRRAMFNAVPLA